MIRTWGIRLAQLQSALDLAAEIMEKAGFKPTTEERGIVRWEKKSDSDHDCKICFRSYRGVLLPGYIRINTCDCENFLQKFIDIRTNFEEEINQHDLIETLDSLIFASTG